MADASTFVPPHVWLQNFLASQNKLPLDPVSLIMAAFAKPTPPVPAPPPASPAITPTIPSPPFVGTRSPISGTAPNFSVNVPTMTDVTTAAPNLLPTPPTLPPPPQIGVPSPINLGGAKEALASRADVSGPMGLLSQPGTNTSGIAKLLSQRTDVGPIRAALDKMTPDAAANMANVFGGLASGAGGVSATEAGSFARALAQAGAGGMAGLAKTGAEAREAAKARAGTEFDIAKLGTAERGQEASGLIDLAKLASGEKLSRAGGMLDVARLQSGERGQNITGNLSLAGAENADAVAKSELSFKNAQNVYETGVKNALTQYEQQVKTQGLLMPKVQHDANGITVQSIGTDGKLGVQFYPTKTLLDNAEKMKPMLEALGLPGPAAEAEEAKFVMNSFTDPILKQEALKNLAVRRTIANGAGGSVFGPVYDAAVKTATKQLQTENPTLVAKPEVYQKEIENRVSSIIMQDSRIHDLKWTKYAAPHSVAARLIAAGLQPQQPQQ